MPENVDGIFGARFWVRGLAEEVDGAWARDVDLFGIVAGEDEDVIGGFVIWEA